MDNLKLLHAIIESAIDGIITIDSEGRIETMNPAALKLFGYKPDEVTGRNICILMPEPNRSAHDGYLEHHRRTGENRIIGSGREVVGLRKDKSTFPFRLSLLPGS